MALASSPGLTGQRLFLTCPFVLMYELVNKHNHLLTLGCQRVGQARGGAAFRLPRGYKICGRLGGMGVGSWKLLTSAAVCGRTRRGGGWEPGLEAARKGGASGPRRGLKGGGREGGRGGGGGGVIVMADAALDAVRRELREFPAAARGEWGASPTAEQSQDAGGALGLPRTGYRIRVRPGSSWATGTRVHPVSFPQGARNLVHVTGGRPLCARACVAAPFPSPLGGPLAPLLPCSRTFVAAWGDSSHYSQDPAQSLLWWRSVFPTVSWHRILGAFCC